MLDYEKIYHSVSMPSFRLWKMILEDGAIIQDKEQPITSAKRLARLIGNKPGKVYHSVGLFLNPHTISTKLPNGKPGYKYADRLFLGMDLYFDLDSEDDLRIAQKDALKIMNFMISEPDFKLKEIVFSGNKGVKLYYQPKEYNPWKERDPIMRRILSENRHRLLMKRMLKKVKLDTIDQNHINITCDAYRVCPADYTYKSRMVQPLDTVQFMTKDIYTLINQDTVVSEGSNRIKPAKPNEGLVPAEIYQGNGVKAKGKSRPNLRSCSNYPLSYLAIGNYVTGLKNNYVPMMKIKNRDLKRINNYDLSRDIGNYIMFSEKNYTWIIAIKCFQKSKLIKIYKRCRAVNLGQFIRKYNMFRISNKLDKNSNPIECIPQYNYTYYSTIDYPSSLSHYNFFSRWIFNKPFRLIGKPEIARYKVEVKA